MGRRSHDVAFAALLAAALGLAVFGALVWSGHFVSEGSGPKPRQPAETPVKTRTVPSPEKVATRATPIPVTQPIAARVTIVASRGDCWVAARKGSSAGPVLFERVVTQGETVTVRGQRIWLELGAAGNVDVSVNGRSHSVPAGTTNILLG
jgi:uncharacterized protein DUF4115